MKLSIIIIAKNAEDHIADAIDSVKKIADEIIVVDNGSVDKTIEISEYLKAKVIKEDKKDFSQLRNIGLRAARGEWVFYLDTDERVTPSLMANISDQIENKNSNATAFKIKRKNFYFGNHEWPYIEKLERLFYKDSLKGWYGQLHESPRIEGEVLELEGFLLHYTHRDLTSMLEKTIEWSYLEAELRLKANHPKMTWWRFPRVMLTAFFNSFVIQKGWKAGTVGLIESMYQAFSAFITYARLWEMQNKK